MPAPAYKRLLPRPSQSFFIFGARGAGKSTWARATFGKAVYFDLLDESLYFELLANPSQFSDQLATARAGSWVIVDEVQRIPSLLNEVHRLIEARQLRFALLGSSARKLKRLGTNLLAGRALRKQMFPLAPQELGADFSLDEVLAAGSIPVVWTSTDRMAALESYVQTYLREEIRAEALVRNLPGFVRFLPVAALFHGQVINVAGIARDTGTARTTVEGYLEILEDTLLTYRLPAYEAKLRVRERKHPKLYWVDPGIVRAARRQLGPLHMEERGPLLEGWILTLLRMYNERARVFDDISYWAPAEGRIEVDLVLRRGRDLLAIEIKSGSRFQGDMLSGLRAIGELPEVRRRILIYGGKRLMKSADGIEILPIASFLTLLARNGLWK